MRVPKQCVPIFVGVTVLGLGVSLGYNTGCAINPARDLAPRIFTFLAGWGPGVFTEYNHWWVVPVIACHVGAVVGAWLYYLAVEINWPDDEDEMVNIRKVPMGDRNGGHGHMGDRNGGNIGDRNGGHHQYQQPPENPAYTGTLSRGHSRPHTPDDEKYQPIKMKPGEMKQPMR